MGGRTLGKYVEEGADVGKITRACDGCGCWERNGGRREVHALWVRGSERRVALSKERLDTKALVICFVRKLHQRTNLTFWRPMR